MSITQYSFDGTRWNTCSQPFPLVTTGPVVLYYPSSDNAGNTEVANVKAFVIGGTGAKPAGSGSSLPLWLVALIISVLLAAIGGGLYLKSRLKEEEPKKKYPVFSKNKKTNINTG